VTANRVAPWLDDGDLTLYHGDALTILQALPAGIAQTCVTSPPYWGLRDYGTGHWTGGDEACDHQRQSETSRQSSTLVGSTDTQGGTIAYKDACHRCGAQRVDSQLGLEATPQQYVENMVRLFREVWRVLRDDGTLWLNLGDSYAGAPVGTFNGGGFKDKSAATGGRDLSGHETSGKFDKLAGSGLKPKDLVGIPWRVAFALQHDGWYLRSDIIWAKPNPMPESVTDRPTKAHEYLFLLAKQPKYFWDADASREPQESLDTAGGYKGGVSRPEYEPIRPDGPLTRERIKMHNREWNPAGRNRRSVWTIPTQPFPEAHFATYPEELVRPCIQAGTSEKGECVECGAPWTRQTDVSYEVNDRTGGVATTPRAGTAKDGPNIGQTTPCPRKLDKRVETTGWEPTCQCRIRQRRQASCT
jgi:DNA modification methylase